MDTALKRHGWAARWEWLNLNKGYTKYRHGLEPAVSLFKIKPWISVPKKGKNEEWPAGYVMKNEICDNQNIFDIYNLCKSVIICGQKEYSG